ncbi:MAG: hypothetical protein U0935_16435 [Pirellulales bacterium]
MRCVLSACLAAVPWGQATPSFAADVFVESRSTDGGVAESYGDGEGSVRVRVSSVAGRGSHALARGIGYGAPSGFADLRSVAIASDDGIAVSDVVGEAHDESTVMVGGRATTRGGDARSRGAGYGRGAADVTVNSWADSRNGHARDRSSGTGMARRGGAVRVVADSSSETDGGSADGNVEVLGKADFGGRASAEGVGRVLSRGDRRGETRVRVESRAYGGRSDARGEGYDINW